MADTDEPQQGLQGLELTPSPSCQCLGSASLQGEEESIWIALIYKRKEGFKLWADITGQVMPFKYQKLNFVSSQHSQTRPNNLLFEPFSPDHIYSKGSSGGKKGRSCSCFNKDWVFSGEQRWTSLTILLNPANFQFPSPSTCLDK